MTEVAAQELEALQDALIRSTYPNVASSRNGSKAKASAVARIVGGMIAQRTGWPLAACTPTIARTIEIGGGKLSRAVRTAKYEDPKRMRTAKTEGTQAGVPQSTQGQGSVPSSTNLADFAIPDLLAELVRRLAASDKPLNLKPWVEKDLSVALRHHISVGAFRGLPTKKGADQ